MIDYIIYSSEETDILGRIIPNNLYRYSALKRVEHNLHSLSVSCISDIFPKMTVWKNGKCNFIGRNLINVTSAR